MSLKIPEQGGMPRMHKLLDEYARIVGWGFTAGSSGGGKGVLFDARRYDQSRDPGKDY
jgi:hypothetical protein